MMVLHCQEVIFFTSVASSWDVAKQGGSYLFGYFHSSIYITPDVGGTIPANKYQSSTYIDLRHPVIARHALFSFWSSMSV